MKRLSSKTGLGHLSFMVAIVLLLAGLPSTAGIVIVAGPSRPELTVDTCHPIQTLDLVPAILLARPAAPVLESTLGDRGLTITDPAAQLIELRIAPDTPPPKRPV